ncbi:hypothetical protein PtA15_6A836 [Puccinia triticina]|uniref:REJ domain-containing protein n=1 Tax=Puccinia triticina TaxID=208348 RepID=A0ABY7CLV3_9BASI|nr:uncharacterized protein PtA15_6A836 [Puccinia triticina]WAQ86204.1 hypothetical protein PtA15_6A836 [Puccinia triticina]
MAGSSKKRRPPSSPSSSEISTQNSNQQSKQRSHLARSSHSHSEIVQLDDSDDRTLGTNLDNTQNSKTSKLSNHEELGYSNQKLIYVPSLHM